jgi:hypothetical protein
MPRYNVTVTFRDPNVKSATLYIRKRKKQTHPQDGFPTHVAQHPMMQDKTNPRKFTANGIPKPVILNTHKLLIRVIGWSMAGAQLAVIDAPARQYPIPKDGKKDKKEKK